MSQEQRTVINTLIVIGLATVLILAFFYTLHFSKINKVENNGRETSTVAERTAPEGEVRVAGQIESVAETVAETGSEDTTAATETTVSSSEDTGKRVYNGLCFTCHGSESGAGGLPNIPHIGDAAAWADRVAQGKALLYERAINGFTGASGIPMAPKGGNPNLSDDEVRAAVDFMVSNNQ